MKRCWSTLALALVGASFSFAATPYVDGEVLVKLRPSARGLASMYHRAIGATVVGEIPALGIQRVRLPRNVAVPKAVSAYRRYAGIQYAEPNHLVYAFGKPNDPLLAQQYSASRMNVDLAWDISTGDDRVIVAIIDTGVDYTHEDLAGKVIKGHDYVNGDEDPMDDQGHGTHCAGIAAASTNNGKGIAGMGYNVKILAIKTLSASGVGSSFDSASAIVEAADKGADVISLSLGSANANLAQQDAATYAWNQGSIIFAASGNDNVTSPHYPAAFDNVIAIGASDQTDQRSPFSNYGADWVDLAAPGSAIMSTVPGNKYEAWDGTSMACPNAAGVAALIISHGGKGVITNQEIKDFMESTAVPVGNWVQFGRINAEAAIQLALPPLKETRGPVGAKMYAESGSYESGTVASLMSDDASYYTIGSREVARLGSIAGAEVSFDYPHLADSFMRGTVTLRSKAKFGSTVSAYIKRANSEQYDLLKSWPVTGTEMSYTVNLPRELDGYLENGRLHFVFRSVVPTRFGIGAFAFSMNSARLYTETSLRPTP